MNSTPTPTLNYQPPAKPSRWVCFLAIGPFLSGCAAGVFLIGWIVCYLLNGYITGFADVPSNSFNAMGIWIFTCIFAAPLIILFGILCMYIKSCMVEPPVQSRRWWACMLVGFISTVTPLAAGIHIIPQSRFSSPLPYYALVHDWALPLTLVSIVIASFFLLRSKKKA